MEEKEKDVLTFIEENRELEFPQDDENPYTWAEFIQEMY